MRTLTLVLAMLAIAIVPATYASHDAPVASGATVSTAPPAAGDLTVMSTTLYQHRDCVGPGLPQTTGPHATHTTNAPGVAAGTSVNFNVLALQISGSPGPCPVTAADVSYLPLDFTGQYHVRAVCQGNINPGTVFVDWNLNYLAGTATGSSFVGNLCYAYSGTTFSLDVTVSITPTALLGVSIPPTGAIQLTIAQ